MELFSGASNACCKSATIKAPNFEWRTPRIQSISSVHQPKPSSEVFALFDDLYLLLGKEAIYFGDAKSATKFFVEVGFPCPSRRNPSDHFLRCINSDFDLVNATLRGSLKIHVAKSSSDPLSKSGTSEIKAILVERYKSLDYAMICLKLLKEIKYDDETSFIRVNKSFSYEKICICIPLNLMMLFD